MGGHGAWVQLVHSPDRALGGLPAAGWIRKEAYGDSNNFMLLDVQLSTVDPATKATLEATVQENYVDSFLENLKGIPLHLRVGEADRAVSPYFQRRIARELSNRVYRREGESATNWIKSYEVPKREHW